MAKNEVISRFFRNVDRRTFLKACGVFGVGAAAGGVLQAAFKVIRLDNGLLRISSTRLAMGTFVTVTSVHESRSQAEDAIGRAFEEMDRLIAVFNRYDSSTPLSVLNDQGTLAGPPPELLEVVGQSLDFGRISHGAFDITVKPVVDLLSAGLNVESPAAGSSAKNALSKELPSAVGIDDALDLVGSDKIEMSQRRLGFRQSGMGITLDGIAKGYIVDRISDVLMSGGIERHLINAGGDIRTRGARRDGTPWSVAVQDPDKKGNFPDVIQLTDGAVATSGSYEVYYDKDRISHHIIDPSNGSSPHHNVSVSVRAGSVMAADALSTAVFVLRPTAGIGLVDTQPDGSCLIIDTQSKQHLSRGWRQA